ncbi:MAG: hypothetical protein ACOX3F_05815 [Kiritimatiellia bacterium]|jgi:hypothetical protein
MEQPSSQNNSPNKAFHTYGAQGAPRVNADVLLRNTMINEWCYRDDDR